MSRIIAVFPIAALAISVIGACNTGDESATIEARLSAESKMEKEIVTQLVRDLEAEINNGGFDQFFFNSAGDSTEETIGALLAIGAIRTAEIVREAATKFPKGMPPADRFERQDQLEIVSPEADAFESYDKAFFEYQDDLQALVDAYEG